MKKLKSFGQHFLRNQSVAQSIVDALPVTPQKQLVFEIGPGEGVLTQYLVKRPDIDLRVVEIDNRLPELLLRRFPMLEGNIIHQDVLKVHFEDFAPNNQPFSIIGNFPYNISSQILFKLLDYKDQATQMIGMYQHEVAQRIASTPKSKAYGILSVLAQAYYDAEYLMMVDAREFDPPPKVQSAVVRLQRTDKYEKDILDQKVFKQVVKQAFNQRRKKLSNALSGIDFDETKLPKGIFDLRAEQLSVLDFILLSNLVQK